MFVRNPNDPAGFCVVVPDDFTIPSKRRIKKSSTRHRLRISIFERDGGHTVNGISYGVCHYCKGILNLHRLTLDHVIPKSRGGSDRLDNLVLACTDCNNKKGDKSL